MGEPEHTQQYLPLPTATFHILVALADGPKHGYAVMSEVDQLSDGRVRMGPGTLYGAVKKLLAEGLIEESDDRPDPELDDERRRYYRLTGMGRSVTMAEIDRLESLVRQGHWRLPRLGGAS